MQFSKPQGTQVIKRIFLLTITAILAVTAMLAVSTSANVAQDDAATAEPGGNTSDVPPVLELLALVPDEPRFSQEELIGFSDFRAQAATREGVVDYESWAEFEAALEAEDDAARLLLNSWGMSGFPNGQYLLTAAADMPATVGFDFFDIDTALSFGKPPAQVYLYHGDFDVDQIHSALTGNGMPAKNLTAFLTGVLKQAVILAWI
jgi:hypothetical protein